MFNFGNLFKKKKDDEDEIKIRIKPATRPKLDTSKMSVAPIYKNGRQPSGSNFVQTTDISQQSRREPQIKIQQPQAPPRSHSLTNRFDKFLSGGVQDPEYNNYSALRKVSDTNRRLIERAIPTPRLDSPDYDSGNLLHLAGSGTRGLLRSNINAIPTLASDTLSGLHRLGKSAVAQKDLMDRGVFATDDLNKRDEIVRQYYANKPRYKYNPISGRTDTIQQENLFARKDQGQSRGYSGMHAALDTFLPFFDIADFGAPLHAVAPAMKFGAPIFMSGIKNIRRTANKLDPFARNFSLPLSNKANYNKVPFEYKATPFDDVYKLDKRSRDDMSEFDINNRNIKIIKEKNINPLLAEKKELIKYGKLINKNYNKVDPIERQNFDDALYLIDERITNIDEMVKPYNDEIFRIKNEYATIVGAPPSTKGDTGWTSGPNKQYLKPVSNPAEPEFGEFANNVNESKYWNEKLNIEGQRDVKSNILEQDEAGNIYDPNTIVTFKPVATGVSRGEDLGVEFMAKKIASEKSKAFGDLLGQKFIPQNAPVKVSNILEEGRKTGGYQDQDDYSDMFGSFDKKMSDIVEQKSKTTYPNDNPIDQDSFDEMPWETTRSIENQNIADAVNSAEKEITPSFTGNVKRDAKIIQDSIEESRKATEANPASTSYAQGTETGMKPATSETNKFDEVVKDANKPKTNKIKIVKETTPKEKPPKKPTPAEAKAIKEREIREEKLAKMTVQSGDKRRMFKLLGEIGDNLLGMIVPGGYNVQRQGRGGKALRKQSRGYVQDKLTFSGKYKAKFKDIQHKYNLTKDEVEKAIEIVRERKVEGASSSIKQAAKELTDVFEEMYKVSNEGPLKSKHRKGYFPQYANKDAYRLKEGERRYEKAIDDIMSHNKNITREEAIKALKEFRDASHGKTSGHLRKKRKKTMPAWLTINNFDAALAYVDEVADDYASLKNFGVGDAYVNAALSLIDETGFNAKKAKKYWEQVANRENPDWKKTGADVATGFTTATTLSTSFPKNLTQNVNTMIVAGILNTARGAGKTAKKFLKYNPEMTKANVWDDNIVFQEAGIKNANDIAKYAMYLFSQAERFMRETAGEAAKLNADQLYKKAQSAKKGSWKAKTVTRRLKKMGISESDFVNGALTEDAKLRAMRNISDRTQFRMDADNVPLWSTTPLGRILSQWQKFNYVQTMFMWDEVLTEAAHKNIAPLVTATIMTPVIGIPAMMVSKFIRGKDPTDFDDEDAWDAYEGLTGTPGSIYSAAKWQKEFNEDDRNSDTAKTVKTAGAILGPTASMLGDAYLTGDAYKNVKAENEKKGLSKGDEGWEDPTLYAKREVSEKVPYVGPFVKNTAFKYPGQNNLFNRDEKARGPLEYYAQDGNPVGIVVGATGGGFKSNRPISVAKVRDADTIVLKNGQPIRFAGINAPESDTAMGKEATNFIANQLDGKKVTLQYDADRRGVKGREVADVLVDGKSLSEMLIREGLAKASSYGVNSSKAKKYAELQKQAEAQGKGFWGNPNLKIKLKVKDLGKDPNLFSRAIRLDRGKGVTDFNENNIKAYHDLDASSAKKKAKELGHDLTDEQLLQVRADADYFSDYFMGGKMNPTHDFAKENVNPLLDAYNKASGTKMSTKLAHLYGATNYSEDEKQKLYEKMGVTQDDAERAMLGYIKSNRNTGIDEDAKLIYDYLSKKEFNAENIDKLFEEKTLTSSNIKEMYRQGLLTEQEAAKLANAQSAKSGKKFKLGSRTYGGSSKGSSNSSSSRKKKKTIKITPYKIPEMKQTKNDYFGELMKNLDVIKSPTIKIKDVPKAKEIDATFKVNVPKKEKRAKIKVDFDTGLI